MGNYCFFFVFINHLEILQHFNDGVTEFLFIINGSLFLFILLYLRGIRLII